jgi:hypothetical protein
MDARRTFNPAQFLHIHINCSGDICFEINIYSTHVSVFAGGLATTPPLGIVPT